MSFNPFKKQPAIGMPISLPESLAPVTHTVTPASMFEKTGYERIFDVRLPERELKDFAKASGSLAGTLSATWSRVAESKREFMNLSRELRKFYIYNSLLNVVTDDILNPDIDGNILVITATEDRIKEPLEETVERLELDSILSDVVRDTIDYGDFALKLESAPGQGVLQVRDTVDQLNFLALYDGPLPSKFLVMDRTSFKLCPPQEYAHFVAGNKKIRYQIENVARYQSPDMTTGIMPVSSTTIPDEIRKELPDYIRVGEPLFRGMSSKIRDLQLLEALMPATKLNQLTQSQFVSIKMPSQADPKQVMMVLQRYEDILNIPVGINVDSARIALSEILSATQRIRVFPDFSDGKGQMSTLGLRNNATIDDILNAVKDIREVICSALGVPPSVLFGAIENRATELRKYSRYVKLIQSLRRAIVRAIEHIILADLALRGIAATRKDFKIRFLNNLVDIAALEEMELADSKQAMVRNMIDFANMVQANPLLRVGVKPDRFLKWIRGSFDSLVDGESFFLTDEEIDAKLPDIQAAFAEPIMIQSPGMPQLSSDPSDASGPSANNGNGRAEDQEQNVIVLLKQGRSRKEIAAALNLSVDQVSYIAKKYQRSEDDERD